MEPSRIFDVLQKKYRFSQAKTFLYNTNPKNVPLRTATKRKKARKSLFEKKLKRKMSTKIKISCFSREEFCLHRDDQGK